jgi:hypothetical protein
MEMTILYVVIMAIAVVVTFTTCKIINEFFEKRREMRLAAYLDICYPKLLDDTMDMGIEMIERINKRLFDQFSEEEDP